MRLLVLTGLFSLSFAIDVQKLLSVYGKPYRVKEYGRVQKLRHRFHGKKAYKDMDHSEHLKIEFNSFGRTVKLELKLNRDVLGEGATTFNTTTQKQEPIKSTSYRGWFKHHQIGVPNKADAGEAVIILTGDGKFEGVMFGKEYQWNIDRIERHKNNDLHKAKVHGSNEGHGIIVHQTSIKEARRRLQHVKDSNGRNNYGDCDNGPPGCFKPGMKPDWHHIDDCWPGQPKTSERGPTKSVAIACLIDNTFAKRCKDEGVTVEVVMIRIFSLASVMFEQNLNIMLKIKDIYKAKDGRLSPECPVLDTVFEGYNHTIVKDKYGRDEVRNVHCTDKLSFSERINALREWKHDFIAAKETMPAQDPGLWHLFSDCNTIGVYGGTLGVAYGIPNVSFKFDRETKKLDMKINYRTTGLCVEQLNYAITAWQTSGREWLTFAHEVGHNFGAMHPFDVKNSTGTGSYGGVMDYGNQRWPSETGFFQFSNRSTEKAEICRQVTIGMTTGDFGSGMGFKKFTAIPAAQCFQDVKTAPKGCDASGVKLNHGMVTTRKCKVGEVWAECYDGNLLIISDTCNIKPRYVIEKEPRPYCWEEGCEKPGCPKGKMITDYEECTRAAFSLGIVGNHLHFIWGMFNQAAKRQKLAEMGITSTALPAKKLGVMEWWMEGQPCGCYSYIPAWLESGTLVYNYGENGKCKKVAKSSNQFICRSAHYDAKVRTHGGLIAGAKLADFDATWAPTMKPTLQPTNKPTSKPTEFVCRKYEKTIYMSIISVSKTVTGTLQECKDACGVYKADVTRSKCKGFARAEKDPEAKAKCELSTWLSQKGFVSKVTPQIPIYMKACGVKVPQEVKQYGKPSKSTSNKSTSKKKSDLGKDMGRNADGTLCTTKKKDKLADCKKYRAMTGIMLRIYKNFYPDCFYPQCKAETVDLMATEDISVEDIVEEDIVEDSSDNHLLILLGAFMFLATYSGYKVYVCSQQKTEGLKGPYTPIGDEVADADSDEEATQRLIAAN